MSAPAQLAFTDASGGTSSEEAPNRILPNQLARMINCALVDGLPRTRPGVCSVPIDGDGAAYIRANNVQGSIFFNPGEGQGGLSFGEDTAMIALAAGGRKFIVRFDGLRAMTTAHAEDITNDLVTSRQFHLVWLNQWENYLLAQDGRSNCFIWDAQNPAFFSDGYNTTVKENSRVPNGGTVMVYAHGRGSVVVGGKVVLTGDILHRQDQASARNLLEFKEQTYWATGQYFLPPSRMGRITAAELLPLRNTQHGHGPIMMHCEDGIFSIDTNIYPRTSWPASQMVKIVHQEEGATGPYAVAIFNGDQFFRTQSGIQTLRSAAATNLEGDANKAISAEVNIWMKGDYPSYLRFCSMALWRGAKRLFCTVNPILLGRYRYHRGAVVRNLDVAPGAQQSAAAWEGLWTLPTQFSGITQFVAAKFSASPRLFAWTLGTDGATRLVEFHTEQKSDKLEDGTDKPIRAQVLTRQIDAGRWWEQREFVQGRLYLREIEETVRWAVWVRPYESGKWTPWRAGTVRAPMLNLANFDLRGGVPPSTMIPLGRLPEACGGGKPVNQTRGLQLLVRWEGCCTLENIRVTHGNSDLSKDELNASTLNVTFERVTDTTLMDFEYSEYDSAPWLT